MLANRKDFMRVPPDFKDYYIYKIVKNSARTVMFMMKMNNNLDKLEVASSQKNEELTSILVQFLMLCFYEMD